jgi:hypothetical protein
MSIQILYLNVQGGMFWPALRAFIERERTNVDIFCLQEVLRRKQTQEAVHGFPQDMGRPDLFEDTQDVLSGHTGFFAPVRELSHNGMPDGAPTGVDCGLAMFVRKDMRMALAGVQSEFIVGDCFVA